MLLPDTLALLGILSFFLIFLIFIIFFSGTKADGGQVSLSWGMEP